MFARRVYELLRWLHVNDARHRRIGRSRVRLLLRLSLSYALPSRVRSWLYKWGRRSRTRPQLARRTWNFSKSKLSTSTPSDSRSAILSCADRATSLQVSPRRLRVNRYHRVTARRRTHHLACLARDEGRAAERHGDTVDNLRSDAVRRHDRHHVCCCVALHHALPLVARIVVWVVLVAPHCAREEQELGALDHERPRDFRVPLVRPNRHANAAIALRRCQTYRYVSPCIRTSSTHTGDRTVFQTRNASSDGVK